MDKKKSIIIILLIITCIIVGYIGYQTFFIPKDNVIELDTITFNTTNATDFKVNGTNESVGLNIYRNDNGAGNVTITVLEENKSEYSKLMRLAIGGDKSNYPHQEINGITIYNTSATVGEHIGDRRYTAFIYNRDLNIDVILCSPDPNETAKMASSLKFN